MCWSVKVTVTVTGNLVLRVCAELTDAICKLLLAWWCARSSTHGQKTDGSYLPSESTSWFKDTDRKGAELYLYDKNFDGAFLMRPSSNPENICTLSVFQNNKAFHISVRERHDGWLALGTSKPNEHCFATVKDIVDFYKIETLLINSCGEKHFTVLKENCETTIDISLEFTQRFMLLSGELGYRITAQTKDYCSLSVRTCLYLLCAYGKTIGIGVYVMNYAPFCASSTKLHYEIIIKLNF